MLQNLTMSSFLITKGMSSHLFASSDFRDVPRDLLELLLYVLLSFILNLLFQVSNLTLNRSGVLDEIDQLTELGVKSYQKFVSFL